MKMFSRIATALVAMLTLSSAARADYTDGCTGCGPNYNDVPCPSGSGVRTLTNFACEHTPTGVNVVMGAPSAPSVLATCFVDACCDSDGDTNQVTYTEETGWEIQICITGSGKLSGGIPGVGGFEVQIQDQRCFKLNRKIVRSVQASCSAAACSKSWKDVMVQTVPVTATVTFQKRTTWTLSGCGLPTYNLGVNCGTYNVTGNDTTKLYSFRSRDQRCEQDCGCGHPCTPRPCCR